MKKKYNKAHKFADGSTLSAGDLTSLSNSLNTLRGAILSNFATNTDIAEAIGLPKQYAAGGTLGLIAAGAGLLANEATTVSNLAKGVDLSNYKKQVKTFGDQVPVFNSTEDLLNAGANRTRLSHVDMDDVTGTTKLGRGIGSVMNIFSPFGGAKLLAANIGRNKTKRRINRLNNAIDAANARQDYAFNNAAENLMKNQQASMLANFSAYGGPIFDVDSFGDGAIGYDVTKDALYNKQLSAQSKANSAVGYLPTFAEGGGIHIAPSKRGTFTAAASKHGKSVQAFASQVLANPDNYSPAMVKKANFARNAAKWHHADGGLLMSDEFTNGVTLIDQGGTHENNPHEGVQMGIAPDGKPNLVEEGEAIFNDYVFSNRLRVPKEVRSKYKLRGPKGMTFAEAFREAQKESEERPNDPISQDGLENIAMVLARTQEAVRDYKRGHKKSSGGHLFAWGDPEEEEYEPEVQADIDDFWKSKLGNKWNDPKARRAYMEGPGERQNLTSPLSFLRPADPLANLGAVTTDLLGITNNPYSYDYIPAFQGVSATPVSNYFPVKHLDTRFTANRRAQEAAALQDAIMQSNAPSKWANLIAANYAGQVAEGEALRQEDLQDYERSLERIKLSRAIDEANSKLGLSAGKINAEDKLAYAQAALAQAKENVNETNTTMAAKAANAGNLAESLANIGKEADARKWLQMLIDSGAFGTLPTKVSNGGKIRRKKKGLTY